MVKHSRSLAVAAAFATGVLALGSGQSAFRSARRRKPTACRRRASRSIRSGRSRCRTTGCSADDRRLGRRPGSRLDHPSQLGDARQQREAAPS